MSHSLCLSLSIFLSVILSINAFVILCSDSSGSQSNGLTPFYAIGRSLKQGNMTALYLTSESSYPKAQKSSQSLEITLWRKQHWITEGKKRIQPYSSGTRADGKDLLHRVKCQSCGLIGKSMTHRLQRNENRENMKKAKTVCCVKNKEL